MEINLTGKTALVTGAGKGIGRATALLLAECGANVIALTRTQSDLDSLKTEIPNVKTICADLINLDEAITAIQSLDEKIDLLVNNAAYIVLRENIFDVTEDDINTTLKVNFTAPLRLSQVVARDLIKRGAGGAIVNVSTVVADRFCSQKAPYSMSKAALDNLTKTLAVELAPHKIRVNSILPGVTATPIVQKYVDTENVQGVLGRTPRGVMADSKEIAHSIVYLLSDFASNITGGQLASDGGFLVN